MAGATAEMPRLPETTPSLPQGHGVPSDLNSPQGGSILRRLGRLYSGCGSEGGWTIFARDPHVDEILRRGRGTEPITGGCKFYNHNGG